MRKLRTSKSLILIILVAFPTTIIFSNLFASVNALSEIPYSNKYNDWSWGVHRNDKLFFETETVMTNLSSPTPEKIMMSRYLDILNITSINNRTQDFMGTDLFSEINITHLYYDPKDNELKVYYHMDPTPFAIFCYNQSHLYKERYFSQSMFPLIVPINGTWDDEVEVLDDILNNTMYTWFYMMGQMNRFDMYGADQSSDTMWFKNSAEGYFLNFTFGEDGVMTFCNASFLYVDFSTGDHWLYQLTTERVFDYDLTDEISWGVNVGDTFYFDQSSEIMSIPYQDIKMVISGFNESLYEVPHMGAYINMTFQNVLANISIWDGTQYVLTYINHTVGSANNFYPINIYGTQDIFSSVIPTSYTLNDIDFFMDYMAVNIPGFPFDERGIYEKDGYLWIELNVSTTNDFVQTKYNSTNGVLESWLQIVSGVVQVASYRKDIPQPWLWPVALGDVLYFKENNVEYSLQEIDYRVTIAYFGAMFMNMTEIEETLSSPFPEDHPDYQFFYIVYAQIDLWDPDSETWLIGGIDAFAAANDYWPFFPLFFPQYIIPMGVTSSDFQDLYNVFGSIYDEATYTANSLTFRDTGENKSLYIHFDGVNGIMDYTGGWFPNFYLGSGWFHFSGYLKYNVTLGLGFNIIPLQSYQITDIAATIQIFAGSGPGAEYLYAYLAQNPVNESLPFGTPLYYLDQLFIHSDYISGDISMTITFPLSINLSLIQLHFYGWNMSGTSEWDEAPSEFYESVIYDYSNNRIIALFSPDEFGNFSMISAMSYEYITTPGNFNLDSNADSPDDDGNFTLNWDASEGATSYTVYEYSSNIDETNIDLATIKATGITDLSLPLTGYSNGTYYFIVEAHNAAGDTLSNCYEVVVEIPAEEEEPPGDFTLSSNAGSPDDDGSFTLSWTAADGATSYTVYGYSSYITEINGSLTILAEDVTSLTLALSEYSDGTYYFIVVASNSAGDTLSNCHIVVVDIPGGGGGIPGYPLFILLTVFVFITAIIIKKKRKKLL